jgi:hypothetical protein
MLAATVTTQQLVATIFFLLGAFTFALATFWLGRAIEGRPAWRGLIPLGLLLISCGFLTVWWPA